MDSKNTSFRVIFAIRELSYDIKPGETYFRLTIGGISKVSPLPLREALVFDLATLNPTSNLEFFLETDKGELIGSSQMKIPLMVHQNQETEINETVKIYLNEAKDTFVTARIYLVFLNKGIFREKAKQKNISNRSSNKTYSYQASGVSPTRDSKEREKVVQQAAERTIERAESSTYDSVRKSSPKRTASPPKLGGPGSPQRKSPTRQYTQSKVGDESFNHYLTHLVEKHTEDVERLVQEHNALSEVISLNKSIGVLPPNYSESIIRESVARRSPERGSSRVTLDERDRFDRIDQTQSRILHQTASADDMRMSRADSVNRYSSIDNRERNKSESRLITEDRERSRIESEKEDHSVDLSADKLRERYDAREARTFEDLARNASPSRRRQLTELVSTLEREAAATSFQRAEIEHLKNVIIGLDTKLKQMAIVKAENDRLRLDLQKNEEARRDLHQSIAETTNELKQETSHMQQQVSELIKQKEDLLQRNHDLMSRLDETSHKLVQTQLSVDRKENELNELHTVLNENDEMKREISRLEAALANSEKRRAEDQQSYLSTLKNFEKSLDETKDILATLHHEKRELLQEINDLKGDLAKERAAHVETKNEMSLLEKKLFNSQNQREVINSLQEQRDSLFKQIAEGQMYQTELQAIINQTKEDMAAKHREFENIEKGYVREIGHLRERITQLENKNNLLNSEIDKARLANADLKATISSLEEIICLKEDVNKQLDDANVKLDIAAKERDVLNQQIDTLQVSQSLNNNKVFELEKEIYSLRGTINDKDEYILNLKKVILEMKDKQPLYIPKKGDPIDNALADYINSQADPSQLGMFFLRESEGVYQFGSKRVYVKVEGGKILIRVGGGFLTIQEFLEQNIPLELDRMARNDPVTLLTKNLAVHKTIAGRVVREIERPKTQLYNYKDLSPKLRKTPTKEY